MCDDHLMYFLQLSELGRPFTGKSSFYISPILQVTLFKLNFHVFFSGGSWCGTATGVQQQYFSETSTLTASVKVCSSRFFEPFN